MAQLSGLSIPAAASAADHAREDAFLAEAAPSLKRLRPGYWVASSTEDVSYPTEAQARVARIEETSFWFRHRNGIIGDIVQRFAPGGPIVDVGGGNGFVSLGLARRDLSTIVVEPGRDGAGIAFARGQATVQGALQKDMFARGSVPAIGLFDVVEHVADDRAFLGMCRDALAPGGYIYVTVPALPSLWSSDDEFAGHYRRYTRRTLGRVLADAAFEPVQMSCFFSLLVVPVFLLRTLPSRLRRRKVVEVDDAFAHHTTSSAIEALLMNALAFERRWIARGHTVPFGTSLIAVARKPGGG